MGNVSGKINAVGYTRGLPRAIMRANTGHYFIKGPPVAMTPTGVVPQLVHGQPFTVTGTGFGTKSPTAAPLQYDIGAGTIGSTPSANGWTGHSLPSGVSPGGIYNIALRAPGFIYGATPIGTRDPYTLAYYAGCHKDPFAVGGNASNNVQIGMRYTNPTTPAGLHGMYAKISLRFDPDWVIDPTSDNNLKDCMFSDGPTDQPTSNDFYYFNWALAPFGGAGGYPCDGVTQAVNAVVHSPQPQAGAFVAVGDIIYLYNVPGMTQIIGLPLTVTAVSGGFGNWSFTTSTNSTGFSAYTSGNSNLYRPVTNNRSTQQYQTIASTAPITMWVSPDENGHGAANWNPALHPMNPANGWIDREYQIGVTNTPAIGGFANVWDNRDQPRNPVMFYKGKTDNTSAPADRHWNFGDYARDRSVTNGRYYSPPIVFDVNGGGTAYVARLMMGDASTLAACTVLEYCPASSWSNTSITCSAFWKGKLSGFGYPYVFTEANVVIPLAGMTIA